MAAVVLIALTPHVAAASGHGPVFGGATPTLGKRGWSFDQAWMGRRDRTDGDHQLLRTMIGYGLTEDLQLTVSLPIELSDSGHMPMARMMATMSGNNEMEALASWRFHRRNIGDGGRFESTVSLGATLPFDSRHAGIRTAPSLYAAIATGYVSRAHYVWVGASHQRPMWEHHGDRHGDVSSYSVVYGYRPKALRLEYPKPDLRFFVETVGEITGKPTQGGVTVDAAGGHAIFTGPTALLLYKAYGFSGGVLFPIYQRIDGDQSKERFRFAVNVSYFFWPN